MVAVNDLRAMPYISMATQAGARYWACRYCNVEGVYVHQLQTKIYIGAARVMHQWPASKKTSRHNRLLREWKRRFAGMPHVVSMLNVPIGGRDQKFRMEAGQLAEDAKGVTKAAYKRAVEAGGYHGIGNTLARQ